MFRLLRSFFGKKGKWFPFPAKPKYVLGFWFKNSIKGVWFFEGQAYAVLINPRKLQPLKPSDVSFLAAGVHYLHCIDDPNDPILLIIDLSEHEKGKGRQLKSYVVTSKEAASLESFERSVRNFLEALRLAGVSQPLPADIDSVIDLFKL